MYAVLSDDKLADSYETVTCFGEDVRIPSQKMETAAVRPDVNLSIVDPRIFFAGLFGTDTFEPYIGWPNVAVSFDATMQVINGDICDI